MLLRKPLRYLNVTLLSRNLAGALLFPSFYKPTGPDEALKIATGQGRRALTGSPRRQYRRVRTHFIFARHWACSDGVFCSQVAFHARARTASVRPLKTDWLDARPSDDFSG